MNKKTEQDEDFPEDILFDKPKVSSGEVLSISDEIWEEELSSSQPRRINAICFRDQDIDKDEIIPVLTEMHETDEDGVMIDGKIYGAIKPISCDELSLLFGTIEKKDENNEERIEDGRKKVSDYLRKKISSKSR